MRVVHISTTDVRGGAAVAANRLHQALVQAGVDSRMLTRYKHSTDDMIESVVPLQPARQVADEWPFPVIQRGYIDLNRSPLSNTVFSLSYPGYDLSMLPAIQTADIIHLHWVARFQSPSTIRRLCALGKPVIWTLHDQQAFTGGCHYSAGCQGYQQSCSDCPQLHDDPCHLPQAVLHDKHQSLADARITLVSPSRWLAETARSSALFRGAETIRVIANGIDIEQFRPLPREISRAAAALDLETLYILFGAEDVAEQRKGFARLVAALQHCREAPAFQHLLSQSQVSLLCFGSPNEHLSSLGLPIRVFGRISSDEYLAQLYAAADLFVLPSLEDNLPNTMIEAMSCGTPVIGFATGGIPEAVIDGVTGRLAPVGDDRSLADVLLSVLIDHQQRAMLGDNARRAVVEHFALDTQAQRYLELYHELRETTMRRATTVLPLDSDTTTAVLDWTIGPEVTPIINNLTLQSVQRYIVEMVEAYHTAEADRAARLQVIERLSEQLAASEADRAARLAMIEHQGAELAGLSAALAQIPVLESDVAYLKAQLETSEADRAARLQVIERLSAQLAASEADRAARLQVIERLSAQLQASEADRAALATVVRGQGDEIARLHRLSQELRSQLPVRALFRLGIIHDPMLARPPSSPSGAAPAAGPDAPPLNTGGAAAPSRQPDTTGIVFEGLEPYIQTIQAFDQTRPDMVGVHGYNHQMIDIFDSLRPLAGRALLDVGASPHGYALERALQKGVAEYVGIGLGISQPIEVHDGQRTGRLINMNAESLDFAPESFDLIISLSTFEHFFDGAQVLCEMHRVLRPGGSVLINFQPVWTCSYGHHLHHIEPVARIIPPWAHLIWDEARMRQAFDGRWPAGLSMSLEEAIEWIYHSSEINRVDVTRQRAIFYASPFEIEWMTPLYDEETPEKRAVAEYLARTLPYSVEDLMTLGFSLLLNKR